MQRLLLAVFFLMGMSAKADPMPPALAQLAARVMPAVVSIASTDPVNATSSDDSGGDGGDSGGGGDSGDW